MPHVTIIGPNLPAAAMATFHVHRAGCADITRSPLYRRVDPPWSMDATSVRDVVENVYSDIMAENDGALAVWDTYLDEFKFFPCIDDLPLEAVVDNSTADWHPGDDTFVELDDDVRTQADRGDLGAQDAIHDAHLAGNHALCLGCEPMPAGWPGYDLDGGFDAFDAWAADAGALATTFVAGDEVVR